MVDRAYLNKPQEYKGEMDKCPACLRPWNQNIEIGCTFSDFRELCDTEAEVGGNNITISLIFCNELISDYAALEAENKELREALGDSLVKIDYAKKRIKRALTGGG